MYSFYNRSLLESFIVSELVWSMNKKTKPFCFDDVIVNKFCTPKMSFAIMPGLEVVVLLFFFFSCYIFLVGISLVERKWKVYYIITLKDDTWILCWLPKWHSWERGHFSGNLICQVRFACILNKVTELGNITFRKCRLKSIVFLNSQTRLQRNYSCL